MRTLVTYLYNLGRDFELHERMHDLCVASFRRCLDADDFVTIAGEFRERHGKGKTLRNYLYGKMLADVFDKVHALWDEGHDILLVDADTLCVRPTPWPEGNEMRLFNMANAKVPYGYLPRRCYLHSGVCYLPSTMDPHCWEVGVDAAEEWNHAIWGHNQYVLNAMFWAQDGKMPEFAQDYVDPRYCWVPLREYNNLHVPREKAYIVHYGCTRGVSKTLRRMERDAC